MVNSTNKPSVVFANHLFDPLKFNKSKAPTPNSSDKNRRAINGAVVQLATFISINENSNNSIGKSLVYAEKRKVIPNIMESTLRLIFLAIITKKKLLLNVRVAFFY